MIERFRTGFPCFGAGLLMAAALPPWGWWPLAFAGIAVLDHVIEEKPRSERFRRGMLVGLGLYLPSLLWMHDLTLPGYFIAVAAYSALFGVAMCLVPASAPGRWLALPGAIAVTELLRWSWPFGGVPLSSLAVGQVSGPLAPVLRVGGSLLLVEVTVIAGLVLATLWRHIRAVEASKRGWIGPSVAAGCVVLIVGFGALAPRGKPTGELNVALVQGGGPQGTSAINTDERKVFERHLAASREIEPPVDVVVWPEDVVDVEGPVEETQEGRELAEEAQRLDAPLIAGVVEGDDDDHFRNAAIVFDSDGKIVDRYDKVHRVPFGEFVPLRSLIEPFAGDTLTQREAIIGNEPAYLDTSAGRMAVAISWEIFFGDRVREGVQADAEVVLNPTNGSSYTGTLVQTQQVASSRMRAIENDRWVLQVAPTGFSAVIGPDGTVHERSSISERARIEATVGQREGQTLYTRLGLLPAWVVALVALGGGWFTHLREFRRAPDKRGPTASPSLEAAVKS